MARITGTPGNDVLKGGVTDDTLIGYEGNDELSGGSGQDLLIGGLGNDQLYGEAGNDTLDGEQGNDILYGEAGNDRLVGVQGNDILYGGDGSDRLNGGDGNDALYGGNGDDVLIAGSGFDRLYGGAGFDRFRYDLPSEGSDQIFDFTFGQDGITILASGFGSGLSAGNLPSSSFVLGSGAKDSSDRFVYNAHTGELFFDRDGSGSAGQQLLATLTTKPNLDAGSFTII
ncbi:calcium-binding protein [Nostocaceae cyanobacterium CENA357]|uniref:Calcium-binding protein n=1 Tax=Atlanticothrix silvestris CENA357 TaxID=1725252 RepID=A0A8J7HFX8_9CYAN|nr:calcium-binding protein [Atlanticothrix silvestris]MBH8551841.1 calcium-binding protein [Atlanticothrix silvestris CENA357]